MRILLISGTTSYMRGGIPVATVTLIHALQRDGHEVGFVADAPLGGTESTKFYPLTYPQNHSVGREMAAAVEAFDPEVCHVLSAGVKMVDAAADVLVGVPWALTVHSIPPSERKFKYFYGHNRLHYFLRDGRYFANALLWKRMFRRGRFTRCVVHSGQVSDTAVRYGADPAKLIEIPLGVNWPGDFAPPAEQTLSPRRNPSIVTVAGLAHTKGQHDFLRALPPLIRTYPELTYTCVGEVRDPGYFTFLQRLAAELHIEGSVSFTKSVSEDEKAALLAGADLYVQPSHEEGFCLAYCEAALKVPRLLGTDSGAIRSISNGLPAAQVVPAADVTALTAAATELLEEAITPTVFADRHALLASRYSPAAYGAAHLALYEELRSGRSSEGTAKKNVYRSTVPS